MDSIQYIGLPTSTPALIAAIALIVGLGILYIKAVDHLYKNQDLTSESKLLWAIFMAILPIIAPSVYLATKPAQ